MKLQDLVGKYVETFKSSPFDLLINNRYLISMQTCGFWDGSVQQDNFCRGEITSVESTYSSDMASFTLRVKGGWDFYFAVFGNKPKIRFQKM